MKYQWWTAVEWEIVSVLSVCIILTIIDNVSDEEGEQKSTVIVDSTETNLMTLRRTIYLTIQSSLDFEECAHKLVKMQLKPGQEVSIYASYQCLSYNSVSILSYVKWWECFAVTIKTAVVSCQLPKVLLQVRLINALIN